ASRRFGSDKSLALLGGRPLVEWVASALAVAGAQTVVVVGGDERALASFGLEVVPDRWPGEGPLGGLITGLEATGSGVEYVVVAGCDLPGLQPGTVRKLICALKAAPEWSDAAVATANGVPQWHLVVVRTSVAARLLERFCAGKRSIKDGLAGGGTLEVPVEPGAVRDVDSQQDLDRYASGVRRIEMGESER
ncbi:MAG: molybdenum cofactor guanylyltransferase, partial [Acidimicrobiales bacterium]|nr:molybdenum cofactor guanylyltransferase [Acidimicrobiales bacterium]